MTYLSVINWVMYETILYNSSLNRPSKLVFTNAAKKSNKQPYFNMAPVVYIHSHEQTTSHVIKCP